MKTTIRLILCGLGLAVCPIVLRAGDPAQGDTPPSGVTGKVLVLESERTLEGDVEKVGNEYHVRRPTGEVTVPARQVLRLCACMEDAYDYVRSRANLRDPDERLRLAQWCHLHGLKGGAMIEVTAAAQLRPEHVPTQRLLAALRQPAAPPRGQETTTEPEADGATLQIDLNMESLCAFSTKVQPVLMNACANCHASGKGGAFKLTRTYNDVPPGSRAVQRNLTAVLAQLNMQKPQGSPLLTKAVSAHGALAQAPLKGRQAPAYRLLEDWVKQTLVSNPHLHGPAVPASAAPAIEETPAKEGKVEKTLAASFGETKPPEPTGPVDPFDPVIFNQQMHPPQK